ncbi:MAG: hydroxyacylglutathione hydrolase [Gemmatimonadales bacterium]|nr:hydroxyacylglutathione hydrolase [Gemmatimonadales bacterium]
MSDLEVVALPNGQFAENCYLVADRRTREAVIIDPGEEPAMFLAELDTRAWSLKAIWLTHAHIDHILGVGPVHATTGAPIYLHPLDRAIYDALPQYGGWVGMQLEKPPAPDREFVAGQVLNVGGFEFTVRFTPGHSPGSVSFVGDGMVFGGDVLFNGSVGRTDLPGGDAATLMASIQSELLSLPDSTVVYSGHGPDTTIGVERLTNPFLTGAYRLG